MAGSTACPFCAGVVPPAAPTATLGYPRWRCACGAAGVAAIPMDVDEALDELEESLGLARGVLGGGTTTVPIGGAGMIHAAYLDPEAVLADAERTAPTVGWEVRRSQTAVPVGGREMELVVVWARPGPLRACAPTPSP